MVEKTKQDSLFKAHPIMATLVLALVFLVFLLCGSEIASFFWYQSNTFESKVESISYYATDGSLFTSGSSKAIVRFDNGVVVDVWKVPKNLREGAVFKVDYRTPYFLSPPYLVVAPGGE